MERYGVWDGSNKWENKEMRERNGVWDGSRDVLRIELLQIQGTKGRERPTKIWKEVDRSNMLDCEW